MNCSRCATPIPNDSRFCFSCGALVAEDEAGRTALLPDAELEAKLRDDLGQDFVIDRLLGRGGMAVVYLAREVHLERRVAIKVLPPELTFGAGMVERFRREARTAATLDHPNIVPIYRVSTGKRLFWYAMKYVEGEALDVVLEREQRLPAERCARLLSQVAEALEFAHQHGVIHRDVKPGNVMIDGRDRVTVTDFGIAKALGTQSLTGSGSAIGTPYYMSPEQCAGKGTTISGAADQYSLGVMAYEMLSGRLPFTGESVVDIIKQHCFDPVPPLTAPAADVPPALAAVVERALAKRPQERFASVTAFASAFAQAARVVPAPTRPHPATAGGDRPAAPAATLPERTARHGRPTRRAMLVGTGVMAAASVVGVLLLWPPAGVAPPERAIIAAPDTTPDSATARAGEDVGTGAPGEVTRRDTTGTATPPPARPPPLVARMILRGVPAGARTTLDSREVRDSLLMLRSGTRHVVSVSLEGYETWADTVTPSAGAQLSRQVRLTPRAQVVGAPAAAGGGPAPTAYLTVGSRPLAAITINGTPTTNPVTNLEVPAGIVIIRFEVIDSAGPWSADTTVTLAPGERRNLGRIPLRRRS
jgi:hypothetical protein